MRIGIQDAERRVDEAGVALQQERLGEARGRREITALLSVSGKGASGNGG